MNMIYDSDQFVVVHHELACNAHGFEIVNKVNNMELFLHGDWARIFQEQINAWQANTPEQEEVESVLTRYTELAQLPLITH